ncbi:hypothetical protein ACS0TY_007314 [Phlomoides rotata]
MSEMQQLLNPCIFHLQKLRIELNCPLCLNLMNKPMLLPCNHIFCNFCVPKSSQFSSKCPACQEQFTDQEVRSASYMENIVSIYKSLDATFNSAVLPLLRTDSRSQVSISREPGEAALKVKNNHIDTLQNGRVPSGFQLTRCSISEEVDVNHVPEMSPDSSPSSVDAKDAGHSSNPGGRNGGTENNRVRNSDGDHLGTVANGVDAKDTSNTREPKRQKKLIYGSPDAILRTHAYSQQIVSHSDPAVFNYGECKLKDDMSINSSTAPFDASYGNESVCAFCHSSKITETTGLLVHYANGKEVKRGETAFSKAIPIHSRCIEWTPQVYFEGETIKNLESELARASKLKCTSCGLKGAALGCYAKSCRRTYHVPCAVEVPECRWNCDDFIMLCPVHKSTKFPSEKSTSKKRKSGEKSSSSKQITSESEQLNFWANSVSGPQEWALCGSALSSEEKCLVANLTTICGATMYKFWNPKVTHVIAATDSNGACSRTLKVLMAILNGKWILSMDWIKACVEANHHVDEEPYEINLDNHGCRDGPRTGRIRASENAPKLFDGLSFYFNGDFAPSYKKDLLDLVRVGGGISVESLEQEIAERPTFVVYNHDNPQGCAAKEASSFLLQRAAEAEDVAKCINARAIPHTWILESIAACRVLP